MAQLNLRLYHADAYLKCLTLKLFFALTAIDILWLAKNEQIILYHPAFSDTLTISQSILILLKNING